MLAIEDRQLYVPDWSAIPEWNPSCPRSPPETVMTPLVSNVVLDPLEVAANGSVGGLDLPKRPGGPLDKFGERFSQISRGFRLHLAGDIRKRQGRGIPE